MHTSSLVRTATYILYKYIIHLDTLKVEIKSAAKNFQIERSKIKIFRSKIFKFFSTIYVIYNKKHFANN